MGLGVLIIFLPGMYAMTLTDLVLIVFIALLLAWAIHDEFIMDKRHGKTLLCVSLLRRNRIDGSIFVVLVGILIYNNISTQGTLVTTWLLCALMLLAIYISWIRKPKLLLKSEGLFFANVWVSYDRIKAMNLSEDGVLVIQLEHRRLLIRVRNIDDLERIYKVMVTSQ